MARVYIGQKSLIFEVLRWMMIGACCLSSCMVQIGGTSSEPVTHQYELVVQTQENYLRKLQHDYARYNLYYIKPLSSSMNLYLFGISPGNMSMENVLNMLRNDVRIAQVEENKKRAR